MEEKSGRVSGDVAISIGHLAEVFPAESIGTTIASKDLVARVDVVHVVQGTCYCYEARNKSKGANNIPNQEYLSIHGVLSIQSDEPLWNAQISSLEH